MAFLKFSKIHEFKKCKIHKIRILDLRTEQQQSNAHTHRLQLRQQAKPLLQGTAIQHTQTHTGTIDKRMKGTSRGSQSKTQSKQIFLLARCKKTCIFYSIKIT